MEEIELIKKRKKREKHFLQKDVWTDFVLW